MKFLILFNIFRMRNSVCIMLLHIIFLQFYTKLSISWKLYLVVPESQKLSEILMLMNL